MRAVGGGESGVLNEAENTKTPKVGVNLANGG
jgi:hypothetical protein